ncbi:DUF2828 family protein [Kineothrix sp. MSJ-39]|uniref:DUF2828 family protein n=1 Tax=Kineothrix sp. MSJ-39 TaxID=2841533 RepID=UPI001C112F96|nr:DUF2828 family protein [Kineothrix sp. MSJ-39]MBU5430540.1 DUF2828 family protein [Kineothrix sp. MSJ-39]
MKRAFWFDGAYMDQQIAETDITGSRAVQFVKGYHNRSVTENGAVGYRTTTKPLLDLNFQVSSLRAREEAYIVQEFTKVFHDSPGYAVKWLFFVRDILEGLGERRTFRVCLKYLAISRSEIARAVLNYVPQYGRYDDALILLDTPLAGDVAGMYKKQLDRDLAAMEAGKQVSLLGKWLPSCNTSSKKTRAYAGKLCRYFKMSQKEYRKTLAKLRAYANVIETKMSAGAWADIAYETVPAKANILYDKAFERHDRDRRIEYLEKVLLGEGNLNTKGLMPYEIVHRITGKSSYYRVLQGDLLSELMWKKIVREGFQNDWGFEDAIVVADGSGSMFQMASGSSSVMAIEICNSLAIYFAEQLRGVFHNKAITFSDHPQFIDLKEHTSLKDKLEIMFAHNEMSNTNIEAVFDLLLAMAECENVPREELPKQVLIISDMEFDEATASYFLGKKRKPVNDTLFARIAGKYKAAGYRMPRLIFWNVCGRTDTIPMVDNEEGLCLLSGFSQNAMKVAADQTQKDPYKALLQVLDSPRYQAIEDAILPWIA